MSDNGAEGSAYEAMPHMGTRYVHGCDVHVYMTFCLSLTPTDLRRLSMNTMIIA